MKPATKVFLILAFFLVGCAPTEADMQTAIVQIEEVKPARTRIPIPTKVPTIALSPAATQDHCPEDLWGKWLLEIQAIHIEVGLDLEAIQSTTLSGEGYSETVERILKRHFLRVHRVERLEVPPCWQDGHVAFVDFVESFLDVAAAAKDGDTARLESSIQALNAAEAIFFDNLSETEDPQ